MLLSAFGDTITIYIVKVEGLDTSLMAQLVFLLCPKNEGILMAMIKGGDRFKNRMMNYILKLSQCMMALPIICNF